MHVVTILKEVLPWLEQGAKLTATVYDDMAVEVFKFAIENEAIAAWLESLFHAESDQRMALALAASPEVEAAFEARKIDWKTALPKVLKIIAMFV